MESSGFHMKSIKFTNEIHNVIHIEICRKDFIKSIKSKILLKATGFCEIHKISQNFMKSTAFHRTSLNSTDFTDISRISLCISLWISFADFIMNFITDSTGIESTVKSIINNEILLISVKSCEMLWIS